MHYRLLYELVSKSNRHYFQSLGANATRPSQAVMFGEEHLGQEGFVDSEIKSVEVEYVQEEDIPSHVVGRAFRDVNKEGIYWAAGRIEAEEE